MGEPARDVLVLDAGYAKAVHHVFAVLSELAERVVLLLEDRVSLCVEPLVDVLGCAFAG